MGDFETELFQGERMDEIGFNGLRLIQKPEDFCYGVDAVILADFAASCRAQRIMDLGTGTGIIPVLLSHKSKADRIFGLELQEDSYKRALRNVKLNGLEDRLEIILGDVSKLRQMKDAAELMESFDMVVSNPPYMAGNCGLTNKNRAKTLARHESSGKLEDFISSAAWLLKDKGEFFMVHRPSRLVDICVKCREYRLEPKELRFVSPNKEVKPNILLIHCVKNGGNEMKMLDPLYVYDEAGQYTPEINRIYQR